VKGKVRGNLFSNSAEHTQNTNTISIVQRQREQTKKGVNPCGLTPLLIYGAGGGIRTRDPNLGKVVLYQLSYTRSMSLFCGLNITKWSILVNRKLL
jgi:hypothetical protein